MKFGIITAGLAAAMLFSGCSNSAGPSNPYPLLLTTVSDTINSNIGHFNFRVTKNGAPVASAKLRQTDSPSDQSFYLGIKSDSNGYFPRVSLALTDTVTAVAYQAVILNSSMLKDSLTSNFIHWSP